MTAAVRWGIVGSGGIASEFAEDLALLDDAQVVAVGSRDVGRASAFASVHGVQKAYGSYEELVRDPDVDVVYVAVPHSEHLAAATLALRAGKPVLVEKPLALDAAGAEALASVAREVGLFAMEAMWTRFLPHMVELRRVIDIGDIGDIVTVVAEHGLRFDVGPEHRLLNPALGGGALLDLGVYAVSLCADLLGPELEIAAVGTRAATGVDAVVSAVMKDANGRQAIITTALSTEQANRAVISGTRGRIELDHDFYRPGNLRVYRLDSGSPVARSRLVSEFDGAVSGHGIRFEAVETARCLREGLTESPTMPLELSVRTARIMDRVKSAAGL
jgi:predicted dehydrogenase